MEYKVSLENNKNSAGENTKLKAITIKVVNYILMFILGVSVIYPVIFVITTSFKTNEDVILNPFGMSTFVPYNYVEAWVTAKVGHYFLNSVIVTFATLALELSIIILAGYAFGKLKPWGSKVLFAIYLSAMIVTTEMTTIPTFMLIKKMDLMNSRWSMILPYTAGGLVLGIYLVTNFVKSLPKELDESAIIDGASTFQILTKIDLPLILPVISTVIILNFQGVWSEFYWALIIAKDEKIKTLPLGLVNFSSQFSSNYGVLTAGLVILTLPVLAIYLYASNYFIDGMTVGAIKG